MFGAIRRFVYHRIIDVAGARVTIAAVERVTAVVSHYQAWRVRRDIASSTEERGPSTER